MSLRFYLAIFVLTFIVTLCANVLIQHRRELQRIIYLSARQDKTLPTEHRRRMEVIDLGPIQTIGLADGPWTFTGVSGGTATSNTTGSTRIGGTGGVITLTAGLPPKVPHHWPSL